MKTITKETLDFIRKERIFKDVVYSCGSNACIDGEHYLIVEKEVVEPKKLTLEEILKQARYVRSQERYQSLMEQKQAHYELQIVADYLNEGWKPEFRSGSRGRQRNWHLDYEPDNNKVSTNYCIAFCSGVVYFKSKEAALEALEILGEEKIKTALGVYLKP